MVLVVLSCLFFVLFQVNVTLSEAKDLSSDDKAQICKDMKSFLSPIQEKLREFEKELKDR